MKQKLIEKIEKLIKTEVTVKCIERHYGGYIDPDKERAERDKAKQDLLEFIDSLEIKEQL